MIKSAFLSSMLIALGQVAIASVPVIPNPAQPGESLTAVTDGRDLIRAATVLVGACSTEAGKLFTSNYGVDNSQLLSIQKVNNPDGHEAYVFTGQMGAGMNSPIKLIMRVDRRETCGGSDGHLGCSGNLEAALVR